MIKCKVVEALIKLEHGDMSGWTQCCAWKDHLEFSGQSRHREQFQQSRPVRTAVVLFSVADTCIHGEMREGEARLAGHGLVLATSGRRSDVEEGLRPCQ
jgi:hypothetical protein